MLDLSTTRQLLKFVRRAPWMAVQMMDLLQPARRRDRPGVGGWPGRRSLCVVGGWVGSAKPTHLLAADSEAIRKGAEQALFPEGTPDRDYPRHTTPINDYDPPYGREAV